MTLVEEAARNNAEWCDIFCRRNGVDGVFRDDFWFCGERTPPLYPDAVTLRPAAAANDILAVIDASDGASVKDSFATLDLERAGFRRLFHAKWFAGRAGPDHGDWSCVPWPETEVVCELELPGVATATAIRSRHVIGLSNVSTPSAYAGAAAAASSHFGDLPIVGYEQEVPTGFDSVGELVVWIKGR